MGTVNFTTLKRSRWRQNSLDEFTAATESMTKPFTMASLYPSREVERPKGSGKLITVQGPMPHQERYHAKTTPSGKSPKFILLSGGMGAGKSISACCELMWLLRNYPGIKIVGIMAYDYLFDESLLPTLNQVWDYEEDNLIKSYNKKSRTWKLTNGSELRMKAYYDADGIRGWEAHSIFIFEAGMLGDRYNEKAIAIFNALLERMRAPGPKGFPRRVYLDQNPEGHNWSWAKFIKPNKLGDEGLVTVIPPNDWYPNGTKYSEYEHTTASGDTYYCLSMHSSANPFNPPGYLAGMIDSRLDDPALIARKTEGAFTPVHALVYDKYCAYETHVVPIERILAYWSDSIRHDGYMGVDQLPRHWRVYVGIDVAGNASPWAIEFYIETPPDENGIQHYLCFDELYVRGYTWPQMAEMILERTEGKGFTDVSYWIDPHSGNQKHGANQTSVVMEFGELGINCNIPRSYTKLPAISRVKEFLRCNHDQPHPYLEDEIVTDESSLDFGKWKIGAAALYYVSSPEYVDSYVPGVAGTRDNPTGVIAWYNLKEKEVYRFDSTKDRPVKEAEEGLTKAGPEKLVDRDDHAQTAEMFAFVGIRPLPRTGRDRNRREQPKRKPQYLPPQ